MRLHLCFTMHYQHPPTTELSQLLKALITRTKTDLKRNLNEKTEIACHKHNDLYDSFTFCSRQTTTKTSLSYTTVSQHVLWPQLRSSILFLFFSSLTPACGKTKRTNTKSFHCWPCFRTHPKLLAVNSPSATKDGSQWPSALQ